MAWDFYSETWLYLFVTPTKDRNDIGIILANDEFVDNM